MALSPEDKGDVKRHLGKALANKVSKVTNDKRMQKALPGSGRTQEIADQVRAKHFKMSGQTKKTKASFIDRLEAHKREAASFDDGTWKPSKKGETFIQALERHKSQREFD